MSVKQTIVNFCRDRITPSEFELLRDYSGLDECEYESLEEFKEQFDFDNIESLIREDIANMSNFDDLSDVLDFNKELIRIVKKLFHQNDKLIEQLRKCLDPEEFKLVTNFTVIHTGDNDIPLEDDCVSEYTTSLDKFNEMLKDMFIDECSQLEPEDLRKKFWQNWVITLSTAHYKIYAYSRKLKEQECNQ